MKKEFGKYYLGLDMGTDSLGWAVTDLEYSIPKLNGKSLWGIQLFESGKTAEERRLFRTTRRRRDRQLQRVELLQEIFAEEICKHDPGFYRRLSDSFFLKEDKSESQENCLFNDPDYSDKDYHKQFPTIYHLRMAFINNENITDPRLLYLAIAHIIKNRGHFLFEGQKMSSISDFRNVFSSFTDSLSDQMEIELNCSDIEKVQTILKDRSLGIKGKQKQLSQYVQSDFPQINEIITLLCGGTCSLASLFQTDEFDDSEIKKITFSDGKYEEKIDELSNLLQDRFIIIEKAKAVYDWAVLADILHGKMFLSSAKIDVYDKHKKDLALLKQIIKKYLPEKYEEVFSSTKNKDNYPAYIGMTKKSGRKQTIENTICLQEDFCKYIESILKPISIENDEILYLKEECVNRTLMPKQVSKDNSVIPYQVNQIELELILKNAEKHFPFLSEKDEDGFSNVEKIVKIFLFKIPYYVGPLNDAHKEKGNCWIVKKVNQPIRPWNFDQVVDKEASAEGFIKRLTNKCTYLTGKDVLPKDSLLYSKYMVLNELNNLKLDGSDIAQETKKKIYLNLFQKHLHVTQKKLRNYLLSEGIISKDTVISGIDGDFKTSLKSWIDFKHILGEKPFDEPVIESVIETIVLFNGTDLLKTRLEGICGGKFNDEEIKRIQALRYKDWGRFSREFLTEIYHVDKQTGECFSIIDMLENTNQNLMQLLSDKFDFMERIKEFNAEANGQDRSISYDMVKDLYISPAIRRSLWRTLVVVKEVRKVMGHDPEKVFIEVAREEGEKKRTVSRKASLLDLYKYCKNEGKELTEILETKTDNELRSDRLYLYFTQLGRCMYSGERIDITQLYDQNVYDIDHIYPQSKADDDSLNNRVLVRREFNAKKGDVYPLPVDIQRNNYSFWTLLKEKELISPKKYDRLVRKEQFSENELAGFIARQLVETRQSTKAAAEILGKVFPDTEIVYSKAGNVSAFRQKFDIPKVRDLNDLHHAKDAYLNIVVGNVYNTKFTHDPRNYFQDREKTPYSLNRMFDFDVSRNGVNAWTAEKNGIPGTIIRVKKVVSCDNALFTRYATEKKSGFFDQTIMKKGKGQFPLKTGDPRLLRKDENGCFIYGGYNKVSGAYAFLAEHTIKKERVRTVEFVPVHLTERIEKDPEYLLTYAQNELELKEPCIVVPKIKIDSLFQIDGFRMHLSGRTGDSLVFKGAVQLHLSVEDAKYLKKVCKFCERQKTNKNETISKYEGISAQENEKLYDLFCKKIKDTVYSVRLSSQYQTLDKGKALFLACSLENQCQVLNEILKLFKCSPGGSNLKLIGGPGMGGRIQTNKKLSNYKEVLLIDQSPTGLFEKITDLLTI